jgi:hypothetical protein
MLSIRSSVKWIRALDELGDRASEFIATWLIDASLLVVIGERRHDVVGLV